MSCMIYTSHWFTIFIASQAWCLGRFLPLLIGDLIPEDDEKWSGYLIFLKIMEYPFAPVITLDYLQMLIQDYLLEFTHLYPLLRGVFTLMQRS